MGSCDTGERLTAGDGDGEYHAGAVAIASVVTGDERHCRSVYSPLAYNALMT